MINDTMPFGKWLEEWFTVYKKPKLKRASADVIETCIRLHVPEELKQIPLRSLTVFDVDKAISKLKPSRTQKVLYDTMCSSLRKAYALDFVLKDFSRKSTSMVGTNRLELSTSCMSSSELTFNA